MLYNVYNGLFKLKDVKKWVFYKIINREIESNIVYEDDLVIAFRYISATYGHTLVVPKETLWKYFWVGWWDCRTSL